MPSHHNRFGITLKTDSVKLIYNGMFVCTSNIWSPACSLPSLCAAPPSFTSWITTAPWWKKQKTLNITEIPIQLNLISIVLLNILANTMHLKLKTYEMLMFNINWLFSPAGCHIRQQCWGPGLHFLYKTLWWFPCQPQLGSSGGQKLWALILANQIGPWERSAWYCGMKRRRTRQGGLGRKQERGRRDRKEMSWQVEKKWRRDSWSGWWRAWQWPGVWESNWTPEYREDRWVINY